MTQTFTYLALGDSYTIGEAVLLQHSFPYQTVQLLRAAGLRFSAPEIIAKTGWTTDELEEGMKYHRFLNHYNIVSLLIGVNNQYRGRSIAEFKEHFEELLLKAIELADGNPGNVFILSIPDYSATPFVADEKKLIVQDEVSQFNTVKQAAALQHGVHFIDITEGSRAAKDDSELVAPDDLHPSEKEYAKWATQLSRAILRQLKN